MRKCRLAAICLGMLLLTGCGGMTRRETQQAAERDFQFYPVADAAGLDTLNNAQMTQIQAAYEQMLANRTAQLQASLQPGLSEPLNFVPEDSLFPVSRYSPLVKALYSAEQAVNVNPVLVMRQLLSGMPESTVSSSTSMSDKETTELAALKEPRGHGPIPFIQSLLRKYFCDMEYQIGFSEGEGLYYTYVFDARDNLTIAALYFDFNEKNILVRVGYDSMVYDAYEVTLTAGTKFVPLNVPGDPAELEVFRAFENMALGSLGVFAGGAAGDGSVYSLPDECTHEHELQRYFAGEKQSADRLLAVRMMDWYILNIPAAAAQPAAQTPEGGMI